MTLPDHPMTTSASASAPTPLPAARRFPWARQVVGPGSIGRYSAVGLVGVTVDAALFTALVVVGVNPVIATIVGTVTGIVNNYLLNTWLNFLVTPSYTRGLRFLTVGLMGLTFAAVGLQMLLWMGLSPFLAKAITIPVVALAQIPGQQTLDVPAVTDRLAVRDPIRPGPASRSRVLRFVTGVIAVVVAMVFLWWLFTGVFQTDRGLDVTDEGLYLLAADAQNLTAAWGSPGFPWGWHTGPLFALVGYDIAALRTLAILLLFVSAGVFGWLAAGCGRRYGVVVAPATGSQAWVGRVLGAAVASVGSLLLYENFLRTPGYNWLGLMSIFIGGSGYFVLLGPDPHETAGPMRRRVGGAAVAGLGIFIGLPAKPSVSLALVLLGLLLLALLAGPRFAATWSLVTAGFIALWVGLAVVLRLWPLDFPSVFLRTFNAPKHHENQGVAGALIEAVSAPSTVWEGLRALPWYYWVVLVAVIALAVIPVDRRKPGIAVGGVVALTVASVAVLIWPSIVSSSASGLPSPVPLVALLGSVALGYVAIAFSLARSTGGGIRPDRRRVMVLVTYLFLLPFVYSFGSSGGFVGQAASGAGIFLVASVVAFSAMPVRPLAVVGPLSALVLALSVVAMLVVWGREHPYRGAPLSQQTVPLAVGTHAQTVLVDEDLATLLDSLRRQAVAAGWSEGTPLIGIAWRWTATVPYLLGAQVPDSLMLTIYGASRSQDRIAAYNLSTGLGELPLRDAWLLASPPDLLSAEQRSDVDSVTAVLTRSTGREFPAGYEVSCGSCRTDQAVEAVAAGFPGHAVPCSGPTDFRLRPRCRVGVGLADPRGLGRRPIRESRRARSAAGPSDLRCPTGC